MRLCGREVYLAFLKLFDTQQRKWICFLVDVVKEGKNIPQWSPAALCGCNTLETDKLCYDELTVHHFHSDEMEWFWQCEWCGSQMISCEVMCVSQCCSRELWFFEWWHLYNYNLTALHHSSWWYNGCYHTLTCWSSFYNKYRNESERTKNLWNFLSSLNGQSLSEQSNSLHVTEKMTGTDE